MTVWRFILEIEVPDGRRPTAVLGVMADACEDLGCVVGGEHVGMERVYPPLKIVPGYAGSDPD